jgi:protein subunit release factor B
MYVRWAERRKFKVDVIEETSGDEAGIKSATILIKGHNAHGWVKTESRCTKQYSTTQIQRQTIWQQHASQRVPQRANQLWSW